MHLHYILVLSYADNIPLIFSVIELASKICKASRSVAKIGAAVRVGWRRLQGS
jgi:hypothetical protein